MAKNVIKNRSKSGVGVRV